MQAFSIDANDIKINNVIDNNKKKARTAHAHKRLSSTCSKMANRSCEMLDVSCVSKSSPNTSISGVVTSLSPMKKSKNTSFFEGSISDGKSSMRLVWVRFDCPKKTCWLQKRTTRFTSKLRSKTF